MVIFLGVLLLQNRIEAFVLLCLAFVLMGIARRFSNKEVLPFRQAVGRDFERARAVSSQASLASVIVVTSGWLFVAGVLYIWVLPVVASLAVWGVWKEWDATRPTQNLVSAPTDTSNKPTVPAGKEGKRK